MLLLRTTGEVKLGFPVTVEELVAVVVAELPNPLCADQHGVGRSRLSLSDPEKLVAQQRDTTPVDGQDIRAGYALQRPAPSGFSLVRRHAGRQVVVTAQSGDHAQDVAVCGWPDLRQGSHAVRADRTGNPQLRGYQLVGLLQQLCGHQGEVGLERIGH
ncbi:hypothetical protein Q5530_31595 [Saccharothrix sp. BKS2]|uniref:hypothetical protein n=1 Tax=Saccharothrix sp. BKS2 TaxID=3064400 RepID=UPI0039EC3F00